MPAQLFHSLSYAELNAYLDARRKVLICPHPDCTAREHWTGAAAATIAGWRFEDKIIDGKLTRRWFCPDHRPPEHVSTLQFTNATQLSFESEPPKNAVKLRAGCVGKVERLIEARPWLTCGDIAASINEPSFRVSGCLNKLKHEGRAQYREDLGVHGYHIWAGTSAAGQTARDERLREIIAERQSIAIESKQN
jgi:hypothetical protein